MAAGALVPHTLPDGRTIMVPDYLAPKGLALPDVQKPEAPDMRVAGPGGVWGAPAPPPISQMVEPLKKATGWHDPATVAMPKADAKDSASPEPTKPSAVDPSTLAKPRPQVAGSGDAEQKPDVNPLVQRVIDESMSRRGGGGGKAPGMVTASIQESRQPGKQLLPEIMWRNGLAERPDFGQELDPTKPFDAENPAMLDRKTGLERGAEAASSAAGKAFEQQEMLRREQANLAKQQLADQSNLMDQQLSTIAQRRDRIARLQETADKRMEEANSVKPRTREEIWESKGTAANILGIIGMALGGYTQGLGRNGGHNPAMEMINKVLDSAVDDERYKAESRKKLGIEARNDYEKALALYGDVDMAALETKGRKLSNIVAMTQQMLSERGLDESAKQRGLQMQAEAYDQYLAVKQQLADMVTGQVIKQEVNYKPGVSGGGGGGSSTLKAFEEGARMKKALNTIEGEGGAQPTRSIEGDKLNDVNAAMEALDAADAVERDVKGLGVEGSDFDDPLSGPLDAAARVIGTGGGGRRSRQSLEANTMRLARGIQQSLGKSDNDAKLADQMAVGDGSGLGRIRAAQTARQQALGRIQTVTAGMTPAQREAFLEALPAERREQVRSAMSATASPRRAASETKAD